MKRSNRLILLIGFLLAAAAFVGVVLLLGGDRTRPGEEPDPTVTTVVVAASDVPLGTTLTENLVRTQEVRITEKPVGAYTLTSEVIGRTVTTQLTRGQLLDANTFSPTTVDPDISRLLDPGRRAMAVEVSYISGVGTLIRPGDRVDAVVTITGADKFPVVANDPGADALALAEGYAAVTSSVKAIIQNLEVVGTLLPAPPVAEGQAPPVGPSSAGQPGTQLVILSVTAQQAEVLRFAQQDAAVSGEFPHAAITLILRSPEDKESPDEVTTGITLRQLVDAWGVIPPQIVESVLPEPGP